VNVTLLFSVGMYERFAEAYLDGLEARLAAGTDVAHVSSVASFFVSRVDAVVDPSLPARSALRGLAAVANARHAYHRFHRIFSGPRWNRLRAEGARPQRPLWASTGTKDPSYPDVKYIEELVAPGTVTTVPEATLRAFADHGVPSPADMDTFSDPLRSLRGAGVDLDAIGAELLRRGIAAFQHDMAALLQRLGEVEPARRPTPATRGR
jgi:transaldolase